MWERCHSCIISEGASQRGRMGQDKQRVEGDLQNKRGGRKQTNIGCPSGKQTTEEEDAGRGRVAVHFHKDTKSDGR